MHLPDGWVSGSINVITYVISLGVCSYAVKRLSQKGAERQIPLSGISIAFIFVLQILSFPLAGGIRGHFLGAVLVATLLGPWAACLIMTVVLVVQRLVLGYGSWATLGANVFNLGLIGAVGGYYILTGLKKILPKNQTGFLAAVGITTWLSVVGAAMMATGEIVLSGVKTTLGAIASAYALIGVGEAAVTILVILLVVRARPDLVMAYCCGEEKDICYTHHHHVSTHTHPTGKEHDHGHIY